MENAIFAEKEKKSSIASYNDLPSRRKTTLSVHYKLFEGSHVEDIVMTSAMKRPVSKVRVIAELKETCKELGEGIRVATARKQSLEALIASLEQAGGENVEHANVSHEEETEAHTSKYIHIDGTFKANNPQTQNSQKATTTCPSQEGQGSQKATTSHEGQPTTTLTRTSKSFSSSIKQLKINIRCFENIGKNYWILLNWLEQFANIESLMVDTYTLEVLSLDLLKVNPPSLINLKSLKIETSDVSYVCRYDEEINFLLQNSHSANVENIIVDAFDY
ncbi:uncharacterized protein LOC127101851 [Lathyrus oleraceus]|nr:uncharacterized protein LOC127101851 [Pisum sativum]